jgi:hypothetical protein
LLNKNSIIIILNWMIILPRSFSFFLLLFFFFSFVHFSFFISLYPVNICHVIECRNSRWRRVILFQVADLVAVSFEIHFPDKGNCGFLQGLIKPWRAVVANELGRTTKVTKDWRCLGLGVQFLLYCIILFSP